MAKQLMDDEASLKRKARRRLVGAVALTTAIVVLLPMLLDSEPKPVGQDIELRIPDKNKVGEFVPRISPLPASAPAATLPDSPASAPEIASPASAAAPVSESSPAPTFNKPVEIVTQNPATPGHKLAPTQPEPKPVAQAQAETQPGFVVQIGAFTKADTAHRWKENLGKQGIKAYTEKAGDKTRVRAGPYTTREAADKVRHKLEAHGLRPDVIQTP